MAEERGLGVQDVVTAALIECVPEVPTAPECPQPTPGESTPVEQAMQATLEHTGAGPPPEGF